MYALWQTATAYANQKNSGVFAAGSLHANAKTMNSELFGNERQPLI